MRETIEQRIKDLEAHRERVVEAATAEVNRVNGGIAELTRLLETLNEQK